MVSVCNMQKENVNTVTAGEIECTIAMFRGTSTERPIENSVIYFWESHTNNPNDREQHQATIELIYKAFDMYTCEKYEVRTGYLSRYNYLQKPIHESSTEDIKEAIIKGRQAQNDWIDRCKLNLPGFKIKSWQECISKNDNLHFDACRELILDKIQKDKDFSASIASTVNDYAERRATHEINGNAYVIEELSWMLSLPLLHLNKPIYLIHVGAMGDAIKGLFAHFPNLQKAVKWLCPKVQTVKFSNDADFLMDYRNNNHIGYSYAMENIDIVRPITIFKKEYNSTKEELNLALSREINEKNVLLSIIEKLPGHVYWLDRNNVYLGCNNLQALSFGLKSRHDVIGKTNEIFFPKEDAEILDKNNLAVMETGKSYEGEELVSFIGNQHRYVLTHKTPLYDTHGKVVGLLGISIDVTDRKRAEHLEIQNKIQENFRIIANEVAHDIRTPLQILLSSLEVCKNLPENEYRRMREAITSLNNIAQTLLEYSPDKEESADDQYILVSQVLCDIVEQIEHQYAGEKITFLVSHDANCTFAFIHGNAVNFERMMNNIVSNSVESLKDGCGFVKIGLSADANNVKIIIEDDGCGMTAEIAARLSRNETFFSTKKGGFGIGAGQIYETLRSFKGAQIIESNIDVGTKITLTIPRSGSPAWAIEQICFNKGDVIVILDDDVLVHKLWNERLDKYQPDISLKFFENSRDVINFIQSHGQKDRILLLSDHELRHQKLDGLDAIRESHIKRAVLVSSLYKRKHVQDKASEIGITLMPKAMIEIIPIKM